MCTMRKDKRHHCWKVHLHSPQPLMPPGLMLGTGDPSLHSSCIASRKKGRQGHHIINQEQINPQMTEFSWKDVINALALANMILGLFSIFCSFSRTRAERLCCLHHLRPGLSSAPRCGWASEWVPGHHLCANHFFPPVFLFNWRRFLWIQGPTLPLCFLCFGFHLPSD